MPISDMTPGTSATIGEKEYELDTNGELLMQVAVPIQKRYNIGGLLAKKLQLETELAEVNTLITEHTNLSK